MYLKRYKLWHIEVEGLDVPADVTRLSPGLDNVLELLQLLQWKLHHHSRNVNVLQSQCVLMR